MCFVFWLLVAGFAVAKTSKLVELAKQSKNDRGNRTAEKESELVISVRNVHSLSLSRDELTLAVCVGDRAVEFYDVPSLVHKVSLPLCCCYLSVLPNLGFRV